MNKLINVKISGAGPTGSLLALSLNQLGCNVSLYDLKSFDELINRSRAYALTHSSRKILQRLDLWNELKNEFNAFSSLTVKDDVINDEIDFKSIDLKKDLRNYKQIGWILDHRTLMLSILNKIKFSKNIDIILGKKAYQDNDDYNYDFVIAADGLLSTMREQSGIKNFKFNYLQGCLTTKLLLRGAKETKAYEILRKEGPFAILPMGGDVFQIVWSAPLSKCRDRLKLTKSKLLDRIAAILPNGIQPDCIIDKVMVFPNSFFLARSFYKKKLILIGESAHSFHPVGGQGLNLCWRDIDTLTRLISLSKCNKLHNKYIPIIYFLSRIPDVITIALLTDLLVRFFSNSSLPLCYIRRLIFTLLNYSSFLRKNILFLMTNGIISLEDSKQDIKSKDDLN